MVSKVYGTADGTNIIFKHGEGDLWNVEIPINAKGECAVEIYAEDQAGNISYVATMLFVASGHEMKCYLVPHGFSGHAENLSHRAEVDISTVLAQVIHGEYLADPNKEQKYIAQIQEGGYTVECKLCREP